MPLALKHKLNNPLICPGCTRIFQTRGGLTQHYHRKHYTSSNSSTELHETDLDTTPLLPEPIGIPPDLAQIIHSSPQVIIESSSPESETGEVSVTHTTSHEEFRILDDNDNDTDSDTDTEIFDLDTSVGIHIDLNKLLEIFKFGDILPHPDAGHIYSIPGQESPSWKIQKQDHMRLGHPYHPWSSENELWLSDFIFFKARMSIAVAEKMMEGIRDRRLRIDGLNTTRAHMLLSIMDDAQYAPVCYNF
jgi:hypothetical protein